MTPEEIYRICKDGARVRICVPRWDIDIGANPWHLHVFREKWFILTSGEEKGLRNKIVTIKFKSIESYALKKKMS